MEKSLKETIIEENRNIKRKISSINKNDDKIESINPSKMKTIDRLNFSLKGNNYLFFLRFLKIIF